MWMDVVVVSTYIQTLPSTSTTLRKPWKSMTAPASGVIPVSFLTVLVSSVKPPVSALSPVSPRLPYAKAALILLRPPA
jgi:hypothetical protein